MIRPAARLWIQVNHQNNGNDQLAWGAGWWYNTGNCYPPASTRLMNGEFLTISVFSSAVTTYTGCKDCKHSYVKFLWSIQKVRPARTKTSDQVLTTAEAAAIADRASAPGQANLHDTSDFPAALSTSWVRQEWNRQTSPPTATCSAAIREVVRARATVTRVWRRRLRFASLASAATRLLSGIHRCKDEQRDGFRRETEMNVRLSSTVLPSVLYEDEAAVVFARIEGMWMIYFDAYSFSLYSL